MQAIGGGLSDVDNLKKDSDAVFDEKDEAGNGTLEPDAIKELAEALLATVGVNAAINDDLYNEQFEALERNSDAVVSKGEFFLLNYGIWREIFNQVSDLIMHPEQYDGVQEGA